MSVFIIAEAGVNHNGSPELAKVLVEEAARAGADAVKFQTFRTDDLITETTPKAAYQRKTTDGGESQAAMLRKLELPRHVYGELLGQCRTLGIRFLSSPFDLGSLRFLVDELGLDTIKLASSELLNAPLLLEAARRPVHIILSTGMSELAEVVQALEIIAFGRLSVDTPPTRAAFRQAMTHPDAAAVLARGVTLLHCTTEYPTPFDSVNLRAMDTLAELGTAIGLSDHTPGIAVAVAAVARGATVIEKHFTTDKTLPGPDHAASLLPRELADMVASIRAVEAALGSAEKKPAPCEIGNRAVARKSLVANQPIAKGQSFSRDNLAVKRPGTGRSPLDYFDLLGRPADRDYQKDELIA